MFYGKWKWVGVFIALSPKNFIVTNGRNEDKVQFYSKAEGFEENLLGINSPKIQLDPHIVQKLDIINTKWELRYAGQSSKERICIKTSANPTGDDARELKKVVIDTLRPAIFVPRRNFIEVEGALTRLYGSAESSI